MSMPVISRSLVDADIAAYVCVSVNHVNSVRARRSRHARTLRHIAFGVTQAYIVLWGEIHNRYSSAAAPCRAQPGILFEEVRKEVSMRRERSTPVCTLGFALLVIFLAVPSFSSDDATQPTPTTVGLSHVRVVRLSFIEGTVTVRRPGSAEWSKAMVNTPLQEGFSLATGQKSFAEVEFENGSAVRIGELSGIDFNQLALTRDGGHINHLTLIQGYATFSVTPARYDEYSILVSDVSLTPRGKAEFRTDLARDRLRVEVFDGHVEVSSPHHTGTLAKNHTMVRDLDSSAPVQMTDNIQKDDWDKWVAAREQQSTLALNEEAVRSPGPVYGWGDLDVYGEWSNFPGYGNGWAAYEPPGWSPYASGMWDWYPGMGSTWVSGEPWGWLPFHYGYWNFDASMGWFWMPGAFGAWSPALVNWYSGPGWIGWTPVGMAGLGGAAPCTLAVAGCLTAMPPSALGRRDPIGPGNPYLLHPDTAAGVTAIARPEIVPQGIGPGTPHGSPVAGNRPPGHRGEPVASRGVHAPVSGWSAGNSIRGRAAAPSSVLMGKTVSAEAFAGRHASSAGGVGAFAPVRVRMGATMGGRFRPEIAESRAMSGERIRDSSRGSTMGGPRIISRVSPGGFGRSGSGLGLRSGAGSFAAGRSAGGRSSGSASGGGAGSHGAGGSSSGGAGGGGHR